MKVFRTLPALLGLPLLAACASNTDNGPAPVLLCPQVDMLQQARTVTVFLPGRSDMAGLVTTAQITGIAGACAAEKHNTALLVTVKAGFEADNGPANNGAPVTLPWFVAITQGDNIVQETDYTTTLGFENGAPQAVATSKTVKVELPNDGSSAQTQILVGFKMSQDQQAYAAAHPSAP